MSGDVKFVHEASTGTMEMVRRLMSAHSQKKEVFVDFGTPDAWNAYKGEAERVTHRLQLPKVQRYCSAARNKVANLS